MLTAARRLSQRLQADQTGRAVSSRRLFLFHAATASAAARTHHDVSKEAAACLPLPEQLRLRKRFPTAPPAPPAASAVRASGRSDTVSRSTRTRKTRSSTTG